MHKCPRKCSNAIEAEATYDSLVMVVAVATILHVVHVVSRLLTEQAGALGARDMEALVASLPVALHAGTSGSLRFTALLLAEVTDLEEDFRVKIQARKPKYVHDGSIRADGARKSESRFKKMRCCAIIYLVSLAHLQVSLLWHQS